MKLITENIWSQISQAATATEISYVAVAYLGKGAFEQLRLAPGSTLVVDASETSVTVGSTNPFEIVRYIEEGVNVYSNSNLHAKLYVFGGETWVGSANVSENSKSNLVECMAFSSEKLVANKAKKFIKSLALSPITPNYAKYLTTIYKPSKLNVDMTENKLWMQQLFEYEYTEEEQEVHDKNVSHLEAELEEGEYFVDSVRYKPSYTFSKKSIIGDTLIRFQGKWVYAPVKVLGKASSFVDDSILIFIEDQEGSRRMRLSTFKSKLEKHGISLKSRQYPRKQDVDKILQIWQI